MGGMLTQTLPVCTSFPVLCLMYARSCVHPPHMLALLLTYRSSVYSLEPSMAPAVHRQSKQGLFH